MACADAISDTEKYIAKVMDNERSGDVDKVVDSLLALSSYFSTLSPDEKNCVLKFLVGRIVDKELPQ